MLSLPLPLLILQFLLLPKTPASGGKMIAVATLPGRLINDSTLSRKSGRWGEEKGIARSQQLSADAATPDKHV